MDAAESCHTPSAIVVYPHAGSFVCCIRTIGQIIFLRYFSIGNEWCSVNQRGNHTKIHCFIGVSFSTIVLTASRHHNDLQNRIMLHGTVFR